MRLSPVLERRKTQTSALLAMTATLLLPAIAAAQSDAPSLGDLARKQREKQQQTRNSPAKPKKVVTDEDLPPRVDSDDSPPSNESHEEVSPPRSAGEVLQYGDQLKSAIVRQKASIADLRNRIERLNSSIHFVQANAYRNGVEYNKYQAQKQQEVERLQGQLSDHQRDLEQMQETARKAGYGSSVWDP